MPAIDDLLEPIGDYHLAALRISNFRGVKELNLEFESRLSVIIGDNQAGKTTVLDAIVAGLAGFSDSPVEYTERVELVTADRHRGPEGVATRAVVEVVLAEGPSVGVYVDDKGNRGAYVPRTVNGERREEHLMFGGAKFDRALLPVVAYYGSERTRLLVPTRSTRNALNVLGEPTNYEALLAWVARRDAAEARTVRDTRNLEYKDPQLQAVRIAIESAIPGASNFRLQGQSCVVDMVLGDRQAAFDIRDLSGGFRAMVGLVADLARRLVEAGGDTSTPSLALIDELDLHLHPRWQMQVTRALLSAFPSTQFIVTTHSEQIISAVPSRCIVALDHSDGAIIASAPPNLRGATFGAVLHEGMGLPSERASDADEAVQQYWSMIRSGVDKDELTPVRSSLLERFPGLADELLAADLELRRRTIDQALRGR